MPDPERVVYVIGAGASVEAATGVERDDFSCGPKFIENIVRRLDFRQEDNDILNTLRLSLNSGKIRDTTFEACTQAAGTIRGALPGAVSIDKYIEQNPASPAIALCGKFAIVNTILEAERASLMYFYKRNSDERMDLGPLSSTWYKKFSTIIADHCDMQGAIQRAGFYKLIIFNYDRCVEHYLFHHFKANYDGADDEDAARFIDAFTIVHPYGCVGSLQEVGDAPHMPFGGNPDYHRYIDLAKGIKTFSEQSDPKNREILDCKSALQKADSVVFLGFAFEEENMKLIAPLEHKSSASERKPKCYGTAYRESGHNLEGFKIRVEGLFKNESNDVWLQDISASNLFEDLKTHLQFH
jgi:hypothetical protein